MPAAAAPAPGGRRWFGPSFVLATAWFFAISQARFQAARATSYDLGIFSQAAQSWSRGQLPHSLIRGPDTLLADHFSPITALFGLAWRVWPDPRSLLLTQALCLGVAVGFIVAITAQRLGASAAAGVFVTGCLGRALVAGAWFDVHEVAFAVPLMAVLGWAILTQRLGWALLAGAGLVLVKEDLGASVAMAGVVWFLMHSQGRLRQRLRCGTAVRGLLALGGLGLAGIVLALVVLGYANDAGSAYLDYFTGGSGGALAEHSAPPTRGLHLGRRLLPVLLLTAMCLVVGWRSPLILLAVPTLVWRLLSSNASYWSIDFHYDLVLWPVAALAFVHAWPSVRTTAWARPAARVAGVALVVSGPSLLIAKHTHPFDWRADPELAQLAAVMQQVPAGSPVAAQNHLGPYLVSRYQVTMLGSGRPEPVRYAVFVADHRFDFQAPPCARAAYLRALSAAGVPVMRSGSVVLVDLGMRRPAGLPRCESVPGVAG